MISLGIYDPWIYRYVLYRYCSDTFISTIVRCCTVQRSRYRYLQYSRTYPQMEIWYFALLSEISGDIRENDGPTGRPFPRKINENVDSITRDTSVLLRGDRYITDADAVCTSTVYSTVLVQYTYIYRCCARAARQRTVPTVCTSTVLYSYIIWDRAYGMSN